MVLMPASTESRRPGGGVIAASSAIRAVASRRLATSCLAVGAPCEVLLEGCSFGVVEGVDGVGTGQCVQ